MIRLSLALLGMPTVAACQCGGPDPTDASTDIATPKPKPDPEPKTSPSEDPTLRGQPAAGPWEGTIVNSALIVEAMVVSHQLEEVLSERTSSETLEVVDVLHDEPGDGVSAAVGDRLEVLLSYRLPSERNGRVVYSSNRERVIPEGAHVVVHLARSGQSSRFQRAAQTEFAVVRRMAHDGGFVASNLDGLAVLVDPAENRWVGGELASYAETKSGDLVIPEEIFDQGMVWEEYLGALRARVQEVAK